MKVICASHPTLDAIARCMSCGIHLCQGCRTKIGVQNFCRSCRDQQQVERVRPAQAGIHAKARVMQRARCAAKQRTRRPPTPRSPFLASALSVIPGLGQAYGGRFLRGLSFFGAGLFLHGAEIPTLLGLFLYVFNLFDAYRVAGLRNRSALTQEVTDKEVKKDRVDDGIFTLAGLGVLAYTFHELGGFQGHQTVETLVPLAGVAVALLIAQETRR